MCEEGSELTSGSVEGLNVFRTLSPVMRKERKRVVSIHEAPIQEAPIQEARGQKVKEVHHES